MEVTNKNDNFSRRLEVLIRELGYKNVSQFSKKLGYSSPEKISRILRNPKNKPSYDILKDIANKFEILNVRWLITGEGEMFKKNKDDYTKIHLAIPSPEEYGIPLVGEDALAGAGSFTFSFRKENIQAYYYIPDLNDVDFMIRITGDSMSPRYKAGDIIACRLLSSRETIIIWGRIYLIASRNYGLLVNRLYPGKDSNHFKCVSDNPDYPPFEIPKEDEIINLALVMGGIRIE